MGTIEAQWRQTDGDTGLGSRRAWTRLVAIGSTVAGEVGRALSIQSPTLVNGSTTGVGYRAPWAR